MEEIEVTDSSHPLFGRRFKVHRVTRGKEEVARVYVEHTVATRITREGMDGAFHTSIVAAVQPEFFETLPDTAFTDGAVARVLWVLARNRGELDIDAPPFSSEWLDKYAKSTMLFEASKYVRPNGLALNDLAPFQASYCEFSGILATFAPDAKARLQEYAKATKEEGNQFERVRLSACTRHSRRLLNMFRALRSGSTG